MKLRLLSLFSGIGAFEKALSNLNIDYELVNYCEIDKYASKAYSLIHHVSEDLNLGDITKIDLNNLPKNIDMITHGSPCQDFSLAGKGAGGAKGTNTRSSLLWNTVEIVRITQPTYVIWENVKNVLSKKHIHTFEAYLNALDELGYNSDYQVLNAKDYGIPQNRERVYCISTLRSSNLGKFFFPSKMKLKLRLKDLLEDEVDEKYYLNEEHILRISKWKSYQKPLEHILNPLIDDAISTITARGASSESSGMILIKEATKKGYAEASDGDGIYIDRPNEKRGVVQKNMIPTLKTSGNDIAVVSNEPNNNLRIRKLTPKECFRLMGFDDEDIDICNRNNISNTQLYKMAGNSIVVNVLMAIFTELLINKNFKRIERIQQLKLFD